MSYKILRFLPIYLILFIIYSCAIQGTASGGPADISGPELISVFPKNNTLMLSSDQKIILEFNELLDPVSIPKSIICNNELKIKVKGKRIIISPKYAWENNQMISIKFSRKIRDFQKNIMAKPIHLAYSTGDFITDGIIKGKINNFSEKNIIEIGLFNWPINSNSIPLQIIESDNNGVFEFNYLDYDNYTLAAIEGKLTNFKKQIRRKKYAMITSDFIFLSKERKKEQIEMLLSLPIDRMQISSFEMVNQYSGILLMNNLIEKKFMIDPFYNPGDSVTISLSLTNRLETYYPSKFTFILPEVIDTIRPYFDSIELNENEINIKFSEPVNIDSLAIITKQDSIVNIVNFKMENSFTTTLTNLNDSTNKIYLLGNYISDLNGNYMLDSIKTIQIKERERPKIIGGNILGKVKYSGEYPIIVEARNLISENVYSVIIEKNEFKFKNLEAGNYTLWAFEAINNLNPLIYFSGTWEPYHRAARFTSYLDTIDVRSRWDIEGIIIDFEKNNIIKN